MYATPKAMKVNQERTESTQEMNTRKTHDFSRPQGPCAGSLKEKTSTAEEWAMSVATPRSDRSDKAIIEPILVSEEIAALMLGVSARTIWQLGKAGVLITGRIGRRKNYLVASLKAYAKKITEVA
jgi:hypothetical protein